LKSFERDDDPYILPELLARRPGALQVRRDIALSGISAAATERGMLDDTDFPMTALIHRLQHLMMVDHVRSLIQIGLD